MVSYDVLGPGGRVILHAQTPFMQSDLKRPLLTVGTLTMSGAEVKFGSKGSWIDLHTESGVQHLPVREKGKTFGLTSGRPTHGSFPRTVTQLHVQWWRQQKQRSADQNNPTPLPQRRKLRRHRGQKRLKACGSNEKPETLQHPGRARDS